MAKEKTHQKTKQQGRTQKQQQAQEKMSSSNKRILIIIILLILLVLAAATIYYFSQNREIQNSNEGEIYMNVTKPVATIEMENGGVIKVELDPVSAPNTVHNFIALANSGFYDGLTFHRVIPDFMIQGGCPEGQGTGGPGYNIKGEFADNSHDNPIVHLRGVISMARSRHADSAGSQFFIMVDDAPHLDGQYAAFGRVTEGLETVDQIVSVKRDQNDKPLEEQRIKKITVETFGTTYDPPDKM
jgi:peptidyl-prolyl cis-trans isomerase B (cyclophilin B)